MTDSSGDVSSFGSGLLPQHAQLLIASGITPDVARQRGYVSAVQKVELERRGFGVRQRSVPALVIPLHDVFGEVTAHQARPDYPRAIDGRVLKYETPIGKRMLLDVPPAVRPHLGNPSRPLLVTEGSRKADAAVVAGLDCVALLGVWNWRGSNAHDGKVALGDWEVIALNGRQVLIAFDSDVVVKRQVEQAMVRLKAFLESRGAEVSVIYLPSDAGGMKVGLDDYLAAGHGRDELMALAQAELRHADGDRKVAPAWEPPPRRTLAGVDQEFTRWMETPDLEALHAVLAAVVANRCEGDPVWLLLVAPPSAGKTEMIMPLTVLPDCHIVGRLTAAGLLSGTAERERSADATGGVLRVLGKQGILLHKDFGAVLAMNRDQRAEVLQALRDVYDGRYDRAIGVDGGRQLAWSGHAGMVAGTTPAYDDHHAVIAALGDRYMLLRLVTADAEQQAVKALDGAGDEEGMRASLTEAVGGFLGHLRVDELPDLGEGTRKRIARLGTLASRCRSTVVRDGYTREIVNVHPPEQPARLAKQLGRLMGALIVIGVDDNEAWRTITRCALDSIPATRRMVLEHLANLGSPSTTKAAAEALGIPTTTVRRAAEELAAHGVLTRNDDRPGDAHGGADVWTLTAWATNQWGDPVPEVSDPPGAQCVRDEALNNNPIPTLSNKSGREEVGVGGRQRGRIVVDDDEDGSW